jgi:hypothetical protein
MSRTDRVRLKEMELPSTTPKQGLILFAYFGLLPDSTKNTSVPTQMKK